MYALGKLKFIDQRGLASFITSLAFGREFRRPHCYRNHDGRGPSAVREGEELHSVQYAENTRAVVLLKSVSSRT